MILDRFRVDGKVAVVTGSGRGIGAAAAVALAEAGADVVVSARTEADLAKVVGRVTDAGRRAHAVPADLSDPANAAKLAEAAVEQFGRLDIVVNNVGGALPRPLLETTPEFLEDAFRFNVANAHALTVAAAPQLLEHAGSVVNISSNMGRIAGRGFAAYGTVKAALAHYTRIAALDLAPKVRVNAIAVGSVATSALDIVVSNPEIREKMESATPVRRIGEPEDIAATIVFLASQAGAFFTGKVLEADGGLQTPNLDLGLPDL